MTEATEEVVGPVLALTDEELLVLTGGAGPVVQPYTSGLEPEVLRIATDTARRSLLARHVLRPDDPSATVGAPLGALLALREGAPVVVVLHRLVGAPAEDAAGPGHTALTRYLHVVDSIVLVEDVTAEGVHVFGLGAETSLEDTVRAFLVPPDAPATPADGARPVQPGDDDPLPAALGDPTVLAEVVVLHAAAEGPPPVLTVALGPQGCFQGSSDDAEPPLLHPVGAGDVVIQVLSDVEQAVRAVEVALADRG